MVRRQAFPRFEQLIGDQQSGHDREPVVTHLAKFGGQAIDLVADIARQGEQARLLAVTAAQPVCPAVERYGNLPHAPRGPPRSEL